MSDVALPAARGGERSLAWRILLLPVLAAAAFAVILVLVWVGGLRNQKLLDDVQTGYYPAFGLSRDLEDDLARMQQGLRDAVATSEVDVLVETDRLRDDVLARLEAARGNPVIEGPEIDRLEADFRAYHSLARATSERLIRKEAGEDVTTALDAMRERYNTIKAALRQNRERHETRMVASFDTARTSQAQAVKVMSLSIALSLLLLGLVSWKVLNSITRPLRAAVRAALAAAEAMARGDLTTRVTTTSLGEVQQLLAAMDRMGQNVRAVIAETQSGATGLAVAASHILASTRRTVEDAHHQAAAVQETIATASELQQTVRVTEERAREVQDVMARTSQSSESIRSQLGDATEVMVRVRSEMQTMVSSIQDLARRNLQIGEIIESVGDVANQTQLLAVNAGIEAAKAGDVGRGFSVVATEMKALADQTKKASQRIRRIVAEIQQAAAETARVVDAGQGRLQDAVQPVSDVMPLVERLTAEVDESNRSLRQIIAIVSQQVGGITQITDAMKSIQGSVQHGLDQNLELERGAESLDRLGGQLRAAVAEYQI